MSTPHRVLPAGLANAVFSRRTFTTAGLSALALGALAACGSDTDTATTTASSTTSTSVSGAAGSSSAEPATTGFPVSIAHGYGSTEIAAAPSTVVSVGLTEQDFLLALGIIPAAITDWYGDQPNAVWPWATTALGSATPKVLSDADGIQFLEVATLQPDLIVGVNSGMSQEDYDKLTAIAPTIAKPATARSAYFDSWTLYLQTIGAAVGKSAEAAALETSIKDQFAAAAAAHPEFAGKKVIFLQNAVYDGNFIAYQQGLGTDFVTDLGFVVPAELDEYVPVEGGQALIPAERIEVLNSADYLIWGTELDEDKTALEAVPGFTDLTAVKAGKSVYTGGILAGAIYFSTPLSLPYILENLVPMLAEGS